MTSRFKSILFFLLFVSQYILAQNPDNPIFCHLSVNPDSSVTLYWKINDPNSIDGFIIKRKIIDGQGVVNGTFNNIEVIQNPLVTEYSDTSTDYHTRAKPFLRSETYRIATFVIVNDSIFYGIASSDQKTIFLSAKFSMCDEKISLVWTKYIGRQVSRYLVLADTGNGFFTIAETLDTSYDFVTNGNIIYNFKIAALMPEQNICSIDTSFSNIVKLNTNIPTPPDTFYIAQAQFVSDSEVSLKYLISKGKMIKNYILWGENDSVATLSPDKTTINIHFEKKYKILAKDICNKTLKTSNISEPIILNVRQENEKIILNWSAYQKFLNGVKNYNIYLITDQDTILINTLVDTFYILNIKDIKSIVQEKNQLKFRIVSIEDGCNIYGMEGKSISNLVTLPLSPVVGIPNALRPASNIEKNRFFIPKIYFSKDFQLYIFDNNGNIVFTSHNNDRLWDGTFNGKPLPAGTYLYIIKIKTYSDEILQKKGVVTLIRD